jgi:hypothetical protein
MKTLRVNQVADRLGKHPATIWRWVARGCDIDDENSIQQFLLGKRRQNPHPNTIREPTTESVENGTKLVDEPEPDLNSVTKACPGDLGSGPSVGSVCHRPISEQQKRPAHSLRMPKT